jgi:hypothetical protein
MKVSGQPHDLAILTPLKEPPGAEGCVSPRASLDTVAKRQNPFPITAKN